jgi:uncharacterized secreted protein with C-terminal beta-propeller domain
VAHRLLDRRVRRQRRGTLNGAASRIITLGGGVSASLSGVMRRPAVMVAVLALAVLAAEPAAAAKPPSRLPAFSSCTELVSFARRHLDGPRVPPRVGTGGVPALGARAPLSKPTVGPEEQAVPPIAAAELTQSDAPVAGEDFSPTNVQEAGIDEPDLVKTDGRRLFVVAGGQLRAYDVAGDAPVLLGTLGLEGAGGELLLRGDRLLLIGPAPSAGTTRLVEIDARDPAAMRIARSMTIPGEHVSARLHGGTARVVITSPAALPGSGTGDTPVATASARRPGLSAFVPRTVLRSRITKRTFRRPLAACRDIRRPRAYAGNDLLTVLTIDLDRGLFNVDRDAILAGAQLVYASPTGLYVASQRAVTVQPGAVPERMRTELHRFDIRAPERTAYASSGSVTGFVLNQYAVSEHDGVLRVATTEEPLWAAQNPEDRVSQSAVTVLREQGGALEQVGRVGGLGRGERIYAVRFIADTAYLVTFRQVDPLYTLDLRDPERPRVVGELKIPGYSAYLHPIGDGLLLGIGQDGTDAGRLTGGQVSVFDVADPARPRRLHQFPLSAGGSLAEFDPHAFLWWSRAKLALLPYDAWTGARRDRGMLGLRAGRAEGLTEIGRVVHGPEWDRAEVVRSIVVRDRVLTCSEQGVAAHRLDGLVPIGFASFAG